MKEVKEEPKPKPTPVKDLQETKKEIVIEKAKQPLVAQRNRTSKFSIQNASKEAEEVAEEEETKVDHKNLPNHHFSQSDVDIWWNKYLNGLKTTDIVIYSAVNGFKFLKTSENTIEVHYPSESAKSKFDKIHAEFFNKFRHKVNHFNLNIEFKLDVALKREVITKRSIFDKYCEINPVLKDLDDLIKFDFS